jgi:hypothetical protein
VTNRFAEENYSRIKVIIGTGYRYRNVKNVTWRILMPNRSEAAAWRTLTTLPNAKPAEATG